MLHFKKDRITFFNISVIFIVFLFALLVFKNPFSERTLISNLEPYPDTLYYITPVLNLITGQGFNVGREGRILNPNVPPLYSFSLIPAFLIKTDPRMAYYSNVILAFISLFIFSLILRKVFINKWLIYLLLILYTTNYFIYWMPSIIMAENLILTLYLVSLYFLLSELTLINIIILAFLSAGMYATKFSSIAMVSSIALLFLGKILFSHFSNQLKLKQILVFSVTLIFCFTALGIFLSITRNYNIISAILINVSFISKSIPNGTSISNTIVEPAWFGLQYIEHNLPIYINSLLGSPNRFLWDYTPLVPKVVAIGGCLGILFGLFTKKFQFISLVLLIFISSLVVFQSTFYSVDARYIYIVIPSLLIGFGLFLTTIFETIQIKRKILIFNSLIISLMIIYLIISFIRLKSQIGLNIKYAETPWYYISVLKFNEYFGNEKIINSKKPILISALPPFFVDYYSNNNYLLLPLSYEQEFRGQETRQIVWGENDYSDLLKLYRKYLEDGFDVYVSRAGLGNEEYTNEDFNKITSEFDTKVVLQGCFDQCNIYSVKLRKDDN